MGKILDHRRTDPKSFNRFRRQCLVSKMSKDWVEGVVPPCSGLFFIKHETFFGEVDIAEYFINSKGVGFWMTPGDPVAWSEIETYDYVDENGIHLFDLKGMINEG